MREIDVRSSFKQDYKNVKKQIYADLVVIYKRDDKTLTLYRIGRHKDLFKKY